MIDHRIKIGKVELQTREYEQNGDAVIFLHYSGGNMMMWQEVIPYFNNAFHVILIDLRGHGKSDRPKSGYHMDIMADDVVEVMKNLQIEKSHIIGSSLGAEVGLSLAARYPQKALSLVCDGALYSEFGHYGTWEGTEEAFKEHVLHTLEEIRNKPAIEFPTLDNLVAERQAFYQEHVGWNDIFESVIRCDAIQTGCGKFRTSWGLIAEEYMRSYFFTRFEDYYRKVSCPVLMLPDTYPGQSAREKEIMEGLLKLVKKGEIVAVPEWNHPYGWMLTPKEVSQVVLDFLAELHEGI